MDEIELLPFGARLLHHDIAITRWFYQKHLGWWEHVLIIPGAWSGLTHGASIMFPLIIWCFHSTTVIFPTILTFCVCWLHLIATMKKYRSLHEMKLLVVGQFIIAILAHRWNPVAYNDICRYIILLMLNAICVNAIKKFTNRERPCAAYGDFQVSQKLDLYRLYYDVLATEERYKSFPSGDVAITFIFCYNIHLITANPVYYLYVCISIAGRMYFGAHHFSDTMAAVLFSFFNCQIFGSRVRPMVLSKFVVLTICLIGIFFATELIGKNRMSALQLRKMRKRK